MDTRMRATPEQVSMMLEYMEKFGGLVRLSSGPQERLRSEQLWAELTNKLNSCRGGVKKSVDKWKKVWTDWKSKTKKRALHLSRHGRGIVGGSASHVTLKAHDRRVMAIIGLSSLKGLPRQKEPGLRRITSSAPSQSTTTDEQVDSQNNTMKIEIEEDEQEGTVPSNPPSPQPSPTPSSPHRTVSPTAEDPLAQTEPSDPLRMIGVLRDPDTFIQTKRPLQSTTSSNPPPSASRPQVHLHRRRESTFETVASQFASIELRRLKLEETRERQQHEREMRALDIEQERIRVFGSLVNIAREWFEYYRSRNSNDPLDS